MFILNFVNSIKLLILKDYAIVIRCKYSCYYIFVPC